MDAIILSLIILLTVAGAVLLLYPRKRSNAWSRGKKHSAEEQNKRKTADLFLSKQQLEQQLKNLRAELERTNDDCQILHDELERELLVSRKQESESRKEVLRFKSLSKADKDVEKEFSQNVALRKTAKEQEQQLAELSKKSKEQSEKIRELENHIVAYRKTIAAQDKDLTAHRRTAQESEWISKEEYLRLTQQLKDREEEINRLKEE
jgi:hypothetical protein